MISFEASPVISVAGGPVESIRLRERSSVRLRQLLRELATTLCRTGIDPGIPFDDLGHLLLVEHGCLSRQNSS